MNGADSVPLRKYVYALLILVAAASVAGHIGSAQLHPEKLEFYSSKPPLFSTLVAGLYWLLKLLTGWTLASDPFAVVRTILVLVNLVPFIIYLMLLVRLVERYGTTDWGRLFVIATA